MIRIESIHIKRFRSINDLTLNIDSNYNIITICGQNNVGKTNVLRAISLFFNKTVFKFNEDVPEFKQMTMGASVYPWISIKIRDDKKNCSYSITKDYNIKNIAEDSTKQYTIIAKKDGIDLNAAECEKFLDNINVFFLPSINVSFPETINYLIDDKFLDIEFGNSRMKGKKGEVKESLEKARTTLQEILDDLTSSINPIFKEFHKNWGIKFVVPKNINRFREILNEEIEFVLTDDTNSEIKSKGAGLQRLGHILLNLRIIEKLTTSKKHCILIVDEPDIYLHSRLQKRLNQRLKQISEKTQVFITTHSPLFIDGYKMKNLFLLELSVEQAFSTRKKQEGHILNTKLVDLKKDDAIFLIKETLGIEDKDNLIIGKRNLMVEGEEDKRYITELCNFFEIPMCNIISTGGVTNYVKYLEYYNSILDNLEEKPKFVLLYDNDDEGRTQYDKLVKKSFDKIEIRHHFVIDSQNTLFSSLRNAKPNIEIEDLIYPEIILELSNIIFSSKKGFKKIKERTFLKKISNQSLRFNGVLEILDTLKNEANPNNGLQLSTKDSSFKGGLSKLFIIKGNQDMIEKIQKLDIKYPEVKKFLTRIMNA
ncbi:MAG: ATP-binding protein [Bacteroidales bacterium]|nr:ATP-binding protein [Bacteroidales bacterium]